MAKKSGPKKVCKKPLTLNDLVKYNREVLFPALDDKFAKIDDKFAKIDGEIKVKFDRVLTGQDKILKELVDLKTEQTADTAVHKRHDEKLENHERRIGVVEKKLDIVAAR